MILIASAIMLGVTGYNIFFKGNKTFAGSAINKEQVRDSLQNIYRNTVKNIDNGMLTADVATDKAAQQKLSEMLVLRTEIDSLLKQHGSEEDLAIAKIKIAELQLKVSELQSRYANMESENKRLQALLSKLISSDRSVKASAIASGETSRSAPAEKTSFQNSAMITSMHLFVITADNSKEQETSSSEEAEKIVGSFQVKNSASKSNGEIVVVVLQPDGKVIRNSVWESGTFDTREGKKVYSGKLHFDAGDDNRLNFSLTPDKFLRGDYTMQIWYNGSMMAKMVKTLS